MTPEQIRIVQSTWLKVLPIQEAAAQLFYNRLFEVDPALRNLFRGDMYQQGQKLMQLIDAAVNGLSRIEQLMPLVQALGRRHATYGVKDDDYGTVGAALLWTLDKGLGCEFTPQARDAWTSVYGALATTMREAARDAAGQAPLPAQAQPASADAGMDSSRAARGSSGPLRTIIIVSVLALLAAAGLGYAATVDMGRELTATIARSQRLPTAASARADRDHTRFLLNALLVTALDSDALPLRWVDPRGPSQCGPNTTVRVNGKPLVAGELVPNQPFVLEWQANACRPLGKVGPRFDGWVRLTVYREDWGFSAEIEPRQLRITSADNAVTLVPAGTVTLPAQGDPDKLLTHLCADGAPPCL